MPLCIVKDGRFEKPTIVCDHSGEAITEVNDAHYQWRFDGGGGYPGAAVYFGITLERWKEAMMTLFTQPKQPNGSDG